MDPYDVPTLIRLPEPLEDWKTEEFAESFIEWLSERADELPLLDMCLEGSPCWDDSPDIGDLRIESHDTVNVNGSFAYSFLEETPTGCRDASYTMPNKGRFYFTWSLENGNLTIIPQSIRRYYERDEF